MHPHWRRLIRPVLSLPVIAAATGFFAALAPKGGAQPDWRLTALALGAVCAGWLCLWPWLRWRATTYLLTDGRLSVRAGVLSRRGTDIPLHRVAQVSVSRTVLERALGTGTLLVETFGERGAVVLSDVPRVREVSRTLYRLVADAGREANRWGAVDEPAP